MTDKSEKLAAIFLFDGNSILHYFHMTKAEKNFLTYIKRRGIKETSLP